MSELIPFEQMTNLPAHFMGAGALSLNDAAEEFSSVKFPSISIKGSRFHIKRDDEKTLVMRPKAKDSDPDEPATYIEVTILNIQKAKTFYAETWTDGSDAKPDCFSNDGIAPDSVSTTPQCATCALCPNNAWGSGTNDKGEATKGKACSDTQRLAVAAGDLSEPMLLRVPPASLKNLAEMSKQLSKKNVPINGVVTRVSFDPTASSPVLVFKPIGFLDAAGFAKAQSLMNDDLVLNIVGKSTRGVATLGDVPAHIAEAAPAATKAPAAKAGAAPVVDLAAEAAKKKAAEKAKKLAAAQAALAAAEAEDGDEVVAPVATAATAVASEGGFDDELNALLS